jgi:hypothetical protein
MFATIKTFNRMKQIAELNHFIREDKPYFLDRINPKHLNNYTVVVKPKMVIDRMINQSGAFILFGIKGEKRMCSDCSINMNGYKQKVLIIPSILETLKSRELKVL